jgi:hypothetical protein
MIKQSQEMVAASVFDSLVKETTELLKGGHSFGDLVKYGGVLAAKVNTLSGLSGPQKKTLVLEVLEKAVVAALPVEKQDDVRAFIQQTLPTVLDVAVEAARGKLDLRKPSAASVVAVASGCAPLVSLLLSCLQAKAESPLRPVLTSLAPPTESSHPSAPTETKEETDAASVTAVVTVVPESVVETVLSEEKKSLEPIPEEGQTKGEEAAPSTE